MAAIVSPQTEIKFLLSKLVEILHQHLDPSPACQAKQSSLEQPKEAPVKSTLAVLLVFSCISERVHHTADQPAHSQPCCHQWVFQSRDEHRHICRWSVLKPVVVGPLCTIEQIHCLLFLWRCRGDVATVGIGFWISNAYKENGMISI